MRSLCVIQARTGSTRLPGKVVADVAGRPLLRFMLDRLAGMPVDMLTVATSDLPRDDVIVDLAEAARVPVVRGSETDVLGRFGTALDTYPADDVIRLTADCPLADPGVIMAALHLHQSRDADYTSNVLPRTFPKGLDVEVAAATALRVCLEEASDPPEREHVTPYLYRHPERFRLANLRSGHDLGAERWTVDTPDDLQFVRSVAERLGGDTRASWVDILELVGRHEPTQTSGLRLRLATFDDASILEYLRNDPDAVRHSLSGQAVTHDEHLAWLSRRLDDPGCRLWIAEMGGRSVGSLRLDIRSAVGTVSIAVDPAARGRGVATAMLDRLERDLECDFQVRALTALVDPTNSSSARLFARAGFKPTGTRDGFAVFHRDIVDMSRDAS